jgi:hypothetical protein
MEKLIYLLWGDDAPAPGDELRDHLLRTSVPALLDAGVRGLSVNVHDAAAAEAPSPAPAPAGETPHVAQVSVWLDSYEDRDRTEGVLAATGRDLAGYLVVESLVDDYGSTRHAGPRTWPDGTRSPGVLTVALIHRPEGLGYDEWIRRWHGTQSPVSGELQPRTRYVRNEVVRPLTADAALVDGIVEEAWPSARHVADPHLFFNAADDDELAANVARMMDSVNACLDLGRLRSSTMSEYLVRSPG